MPPISSYHHHLPDPSSAIGNLWQAIESLDFQWVTPAHHQPQSARFVSRSKIFVVWQYVSQNEASIDLQNTRGRVRLRETGYQQPTGQHELHSCESDVWNWPNSKSSGSFSVV